MKLDKAIKVGLMVFTMLELDVYCTCTYTVYM